MKGEQRIMMQDWFRKARLGIFIHYGIYAVGDVSESCPSTTETFLMRII